MSSRDHSSGATDSEAIGGGVGSSGLSSTSTGSGTLWASTGGPSAGASSSCPVSVVSSMGGSSFYSIVLGGLVCLAASRSRSKASASRRNIM